MHRGTRELIDAGSQVTTSIPAGEELTATALGVAELSHREFTAGASIEATVSSENCVLRAGESAPDTPHKPEVVRRLP